MCTFNERKVDTSKKVKSIKRKHGSRRVSLDLLTLEIKCITTQTYFLRLKCNLQLYKLTIINTEQFRADLLTLLIALPPFVAHPDSGIAVILSY